MNKYEELVRLTTEEMYELGTEGSNRDHCTFDFSFISIDDYKGFFNTLPNIIYKKCISLRLCNDFERSMEHELHVDNFLTEEQQSNDHIDKEIERYEQSIRFRKPGYSNYLAKIIWKALPKTKFLTSLEFDQIPFSSESFRLITNAIKRSRRLKSITFANLIIEDKDFEFFLENVSPYKLDNISFINCHITADAYDALYEYVNRQPPQNNQGSQKKFAKLVLRGNGIKYNQKTGEVKRKFKPEDSIKEKEIVTFNVNWIEQDPDDQSQNAQKFLILRNIRDIVSTVKPASPTNNLRKQNESLKREFEELIYAIRAVKYSDDVYLIGEDAQRCVDKVKAAENVIQQYELKHGEIIV